MHCSHNVKQSEHGEHHAFGRLSTCPHGLHCIFTLGCLQIAHLSVTPCLSLDANAWIVFIITDLSRQLLWAQSQHEDQQFALDAAASHLLFYLKESGINSIPDDLVNAYGDKYVTAWEGFGPAAMVPLPSPQVQPDRPGIVLSCSYASRCHGDAQVYIARGLSHI